MLICPCCKRTLVQHIRYNAGLPVVWYDCICGYTSEHDTLYSNKTDSKFISGWNKNRKSNDTNNL